MKNKNKLYVSNLTSIYTLFYILFFSLSNRVPLLEYYTKFLYIIFSFIFVSKVVTFTHTENITDI